MSFMAIPRSKHTKSRRNKGRIHLFLRQPAVSVCPKCGKEAQPHRVCWNCGYYKQEEVIKVLEKLNKKEKKKREKEIAAKGKESKTEKPLAMEELSKR